MKGREWGEENLFPASYGDLIWIIEFGMRELEGIHREQRYAGAACMYHNSSLFLLRILLALGIIVWLRNRYAATP